MFCEQQRTLSVRTNSRVRQALARRDIYVEEFDYLTGELTTNQNWFVLYLPDCYLNVFLRRATTGRCSFYAIGTGQTVL